LAWRGRRRETWLGVDANDLAELADDHQFAGFIHEHDGCGFSDLRSCLEIADPLGAAGRETVFVDIGALAEAVLGDGEDEVFDSRTACRRDASVPFSASSKGPSRRSYQWFESCSSSGDPLRRSSRAFLGAPLWRHCRRARQFPQVFLVMPRPGRATRSRSNVARYIGISNGGANDVIAFFERNAFVARRIATHGAQSTVSFQGRIPSSKRIAMPSRVAQEDGLFAVGDVGGDQVIIVVDGDGDDAAGHDVGRSP